MLPRKYLLHLIKEITLALIYGMGWLVLLAASNHPIDEWAITAAGLYVCMWIAREAIVSIANFVGRRIAAYGGRVLRRAGVESLPERRLAEFSPREKLLAVVIALLLIAAIIGLSVGVVNPALRWFALTPIASYFIVAGWALFGIGVIGVGSFFAGAWLTINRLNAVIDKPNEKSVERLAGFQLITDKAAAFAGAAR